MRSNGGEAIVVPGRATLIGEHTDYNGGLSLGVALDLVTVVRPTNSEEPAVTVNSQGFGIYESTRPPKDTWEKMVSALIERLGPHSLLVEVTTSIPPGVGLSSSAAFVAGLALAFGATGELVDLARLCQSAEAASGQNVGLLDPLVCLGATQDHGLLIDFSTLEHTSVRLPEGVDFLLVDSGVRRELASSAYAERRRECEEVSSLLGGWPGASTSSVAAILDPRLARRARHVLSETDRVLRFVNAAAREDLDLIGEILTESHASLRDDFEVSDPRVDVLVDELIRHNGVLGARLVGGGFGGCVLVAHLPGLSPDVGPRRSWPVVASAGALERLRRATR